MWILRECIFIVFVVAVCVCVTLSVCLNVLKLVMHMKMDDEHFMEELDVKFMHVKKEVAA